MPVFDHPTLGQSRPNGEVPRRCSLCLAEVDEEGHVPLMLFGRDEHPDGYLPLWVYCEDCEKAIWPHIARDGKG